MVVIERVRTRTKRSLCESIQICLGMQEDDESSYEAEPASDECHDDLDFDETSEEEIKE